MGQPAPFFDVQGGLSSTTVVLRLKEGAFRDARLRGPEADAEADALPLLSPRLRAVAASWKAMRLQRIQASAFRSPALARVHGLDRTYVLTVPPGTDTLRLSAALEAHNDQIEMASPDGIGGVAGQFIPPDSAFLNQWGMHNVGQFVGSNGTPDADIDAPEAWAIHTGEGGQQVVVAVLDSGVSSHPEYGNNLGANSTGRILPGWNTVLNSGTANDLQDLCGVLGHGTHVAGIIGAAGGYRCGGATTHAGSSCETVDDCGRACAGGTNNGLACDEDGDCPNATCGVPTCQAPGVAGVSWGAYLLPVKILGIPDACSGNATYLIDGILWAANHGADIVNMSLQYRLNSTTQQTTITALQDAVNYAHDLGVLLIAAAGNNDFCSNNLPPVNDVVCYPARLNNVLAVTATDNQDQLWAFSNFGPEVDVAAPGKDIYSTVRNGSYNYISGTSMATPHVSGLAALIKSYVPDLSHDEIAEIIMTTAEDRGDPGWDIRYGFGRINAHAALLAARHWPGILQSDPPDGAVDAGRPLVPSTLEPVGWSTVEIAFARNAGGVASADFAVVQTGVEPPPAIVGLETIDEERVRLFLEQPIEPKQWTTITHLATGTRVRLGYLPGDVSGEGFTSPADILALIDSLNGVVPRPVWSTDVDRSNEANPRDIIGLIDLLNGVPPFESYNSASLPPMP